MSVIVIDPGHGGDVNVGGSDANHAKSPSGVTEKSITLDLARRIRWSLTAGTGLAHATAQGKVVTVVLTRDADVNLSLGDRAACAAANDADLYLSIHCNGYDKPARGTEAYIDRKYMEAVEVLTAGTTSIREGPGLPQSGLRNLNVADDAAFAAAVAAAALSAMKPFEPGCKLRSASYTKKDHGEAYAPPPGVKMAGLGTLRDAKLGTSGNQCRACLLELEFISEAKVDQMLNGAKANDVRNALAAALARALVDAL